MGHIENAIFKDENIKPTIYARYVNVIFIEITLEDELLKIKRLYMNTIIIEKEN